MGGEGVTGGEKAGISAGVPAAVQRNPKQTGNARKCGKRKYANM